jgi:hypothetical protein
MLPGVTVVYVVANVTVAAFPTHVGTNVSAVPSPELAGTEYALYVSGTDAGFDSDPMFSIVAVTVTAAPSVGFGGVNETDVTSIFFTSSVSVNVVEPA